MAVQRSKKGEGVEKTQEQKGSLNLSEQGDDLGNFKKVGETRLMIVRE